MAGESISSLLEVIAWEVQQPMGQAERVRSACKQLGKKIGTQPDPENLVRLQRLPLLLENRATAVIAPLFDFLNALCLTIDQPWPLLAGMLSVGNAALVRRALETAGALAASGALPVTSETAVFLAERLATEHSPLREPDCLTLITAILRYLDQPEPDAGKDPIAGLYLKATDIRLRILAAHLLDAIQPAGPAPETAAKILGPEAGRFLAPYLAATRASHLDLVHLAPNPGKPPPVLVSLQKARDLCGPEAVTRVIDALGWQALNLGVDFCDYLSLRIADSYPLLVPPEAQPLMMAVEDAESCGRYALFISNGGLPAPGKADCQTDDAVARFRSLNMTHSEALSHFLNVAPLTPPGIRATLALMDRIVEDYTVLFAPLTDECTILPEVYRKLKNRILKSLAKEKNTARLSLELTRLVQAFEEPASLGAVGTLHGLKRYLHQRGLRYGLKLVDTTRAPDRVVALAAVLPDGDVRVANCIQYIDFAGADTSREGHPLSHAVRIVAENFGRQLLRGRETFPNVKIFCYGNEVHYYISFRGHPAFLRIDYSPPSRGGMIDLEYFGVSKNDFNYHPNPSLDALQRFFLALGFSIKIKVTRVHVRYDKEKALDLGDLLAKAAALFQLVPYLMEIDWVIGDLDLSVNTRPKVTEAWIAFFEAWGVLPLHELLTSDRLGILTKRDSKGEHAWSGKGPYRDRFAPLPTEKIFAELQSRLEKLGLNVITPLELYSLPSLGQAALEKYFWQPLRSRISAGGVLTTSEDYRRPPPDLFRKDHETRRFALILTGADQHLQEAARVARMAVPLEKTLRFQTTGNVNGYFVHRARLALFEGAIYLYVLRDDTDAIVLALFSRDEEPHKKRPNPCLPWRTNLRCDPQQFAALLAGAYYPVSAEKSDEQQVRIDAAAIRARFGSENPSPPHGTIEGERLIKGIKVSPGRTLGTVLFGTRERTPGEFKGAILVSPSVRPEDSTYLYQAAGIVTTGGSILSHAGLLAMQFRKPSMIVNGKWRVSGRGDPILLLYPLDYREKIEHLNGCRVVKRHDIHYRELPLREGDLVVLDVNNGFLRVLGQSRDASILHEHLQQFGIVCRRLFRTTDERKFLKIRGERLKILYQIEKHLSQLNQPVLACHVIHELLLGEHLSGVAKNVHENARLLSRILKNPKVGAICRRYLLMTAGELTNRHRMLARNIRDLAPSSTDPVELLTLRLRETRLRQSLNEIIEAMQASGFDFHTKAGEIAASPSVDEMIRPRLEILRTRLIREIESADEPRREHASLRHLLRRLTRLNAILGNLKTHDQLAERIQIRIAGQDRAARRRYSEQRILWSHEAGFELFPAIGWKAANLAEIERIGGAGLTPPWFAVTDVAFREVMAQLLIGRFKKRGRLKPGMTLGEGIQAVLSRDDLDNFEKTEQIRQLWQTVVLPSDLVRAVTEAYRNLSEGAGEEAPPKGVTVALRSSAREEDTEGSVRAGEFDTFLYLTGENALLNHLKLAWSGLWNERAIRNRELVKGGFEEIGGGLIVQQNIFPRVSGVLQTVNVADYEMREMVVNAGLGVGAGIVSGAVAADHFVVLKENDVDEVRLRHSPLINDKREQVVFNARKGVGTVRAEVSYHQRLRPALEYVELCELVRIASRLEKVYGYPLDIEFCVEGARVWLLQARPVPTFESVLRKTLKDHPLAKMER